MAQQVLTGGISTERYPNWDSKGRIYYTDENGNVIPDTSSFVDKLVNTGRKLKATAHNIGNWINETNPDSEAYKQKANLVLGLATAPFGMGATATKALGAKLAPVLGNKIAQMTAQGLGGGLVSGSVEGFGRGLIEDKNPLKTAITDAGIGTVAGGLGGLALGNAGKYLARKGALGNPNNAGAYIDDYVSGITNPNKADLRDMRAYRVGGELASGKPEIAYDLAPDYDTNLKKWFGNSKVVDENGNPLVVYHGTNADFDTFDKSKIGSVTDAGYTGQGFYGHIDKDTANVYGKNVMPLYLKSENIYDFNNGKSIYDNYRAMGIEPDDMYDPYYDPPEVREANISKAVTKWLKDNNYDGAKLWGQYMVLEPNQIKSVNNQGTFDPTNPNIYKSILGVLGTGEMLRRLQPQSRFQEELLQ